MYPKPVDKLTEADFAAHSVWEFDLENEGHPDRDETWVYPVVQLPVDDLDNRIVSTFVTLANGVRVRAILSNIDLKYHDVTREFMALSLVVKGETFYLARYFDVGYERWGPLELSRFLELPVTDVFPIAYDLSACAMGDEAIIKGTIPAEPAERLNKDQRSVLLFKS